MEPLIIEAHEEITPGVVFDKAAGKFEISGWSLPEDAIKFYAPVLAWLDKYKESPNAETHLHIKLEYFNTASSKQVYRVISALEAVMPKGKATIHWHYDKDDEDMKDVGERLQRMSTVPFVYSAD